MTIGVSPSGLGEAEDLSARAVRIGLTPRQQQALRVIREHHSDTGWPITLAELASALGCGRPNAIDLVKRLRRVGVVETRRGRVGVIPAIAAKDVA